MTYRIRTILAAVCFSILAVSCSKPAQNKTQGLTSAYEEGQQFADKMISTCGEDTIAMQTFLLDFHVKYAEIEEADSKFAANDFRNGFSDRVKEIAPATAQTIFED
ncbi:MAG: hypothetical protein HUK14_02810 [Muribaculaceae bacterium]|nr:hypothetical protein [Muribaculaceae bacterium]